MGLVMDGLQVVSLRPYLDVLYRHRLGAVCALAIGLGITAFLITILPDVYVSSTLVLIEQQTVAPSSASAPPVPDPVARVNALTDEALSRTRLAEIVRQLNLYPDARAAGAPIDLVADRMRRHILVELNNKDDSERPTSFRITFEYPDAAIVQQTTARLAQTYIDEDLGERSHQAESASAFLGDQVAAAQAKVRHKADEIEAYKMRYQGALPEQLEDDFRQLDRLQEQVNTIDETLKSVKQASPETKLQELETRLTTMRAQYSEAHPDVQALRAQIEALQLAQREASRAGSPGDAADKEDAGGTRALRAQKQALQQQMERLHEEIAEAPTREQELGVLNREYDVLGKDYEQLLHKQLDAQVAARLEQSQGGAHLQVLEAAELPLHPTRPNRFAIVALGAIFSVAAALLLPFALFFTDTSFKDPDELGKAYGLPVLVAIPLVAEVSGRSDWLRAGIRAATVSCVTLGVALAAVWIYATRFF
jgi:succinoglycan biosynthesis transport protein ExoP